MAKYNATNYTEYGYVGLNVVGGGNYYRFNLQGTERMRITSGGNVGIGYTPQTRGAGWIGLDLGGTTASEIGGEARTRLTANIYHNGTSNIYKNNYGGLSYYQDAVSSSHLWYTAPTGTGGDVATLTERMRITSAGVVEITNGIKLGGTAAANLLDDYEEGTWTPVLGGTWTTDPTNITGHYTKIGRQVTITMQFIGGAKSSSISGYFTGIPFNIIKNGTGSVSDSGVQNLGNCLFANTNRVWFTATNLGSGTVYVSGTYFAA
jgi:hypothetical protein